MSDRDEDQSTLRGQASQGRDCGPTVLTGGKGVQADNVKETGSGSESAETALRGSPRRARDLGLRERLENPYTYQSEACVRPSQRPQKIIPEN